MEIWMSRQFGLKPRWQREHLALGGSSSAMRVLIALEFALKNRSPASSHLKLSFPCSELPSSPASWRGYHDRQRTLRS
jgi:hypothetical protein